MQKSSSLWHLGTFRFSHVDCPPSFSAAPLQMLLWEPKGLMMGVNVGRGIWRYFWQNEGNESFEVGKAGFPWNLEHMNVEGSAGARTLNPRWLWFTLSRSSLLLGRSLFIFHLNGIWKQRNLTRNWSLTRFQTKFCRFRSEVNWTWWNCVLRFFPYLYKWTICALYQV